MRESRLILIPLAFGLLACTGVCTGIGEKLGIGGDGEADGDVKTEAPKAVEAPKGFKCDSGEVGGGVAVTHADGWWTLAGDGDAGERLKKFWSMPEVFAAKGAKDAHYYCSESGKWTGPYWRLTHDPETWVSGHYENSEPHGTWTGGSGDDVGEKVRFKGHYSYGQKDGSWTFYAGDDEEVISARGHFREDQAHGDWTFFKGTATSQSYRYIHGTQHGLWTETGVDGETQTRKSGAYFNGAKHGVWIEETSADGKAWEQTAKEVWDMGTARGASARDPLAGEDGARETLKAYLDADLAGGRLSSAGYQKYPVLTDFADETQFEDGDATYEKVFITHQYVIKDVAITGATAKVKVEYTENCEVIGGASTNRTGETNLVEYTLKEQDGFWRLDTPAVAPHTTGKAFMDSVGGPGNSGLGGDFIANCGAGDRAGSGEGKVGKGNKAGRGDGNKIGDGKGKKGGKGGKNGKSKANQ